MKKRTIIRFGSALFVLLLLFLTGCAAIKNGVPPAPQAPLIAQWHPRYPISVCVRIPTQEEFGRKFSKYERELSAYRLTNILTECRLFKEVTVSNIATNALFIEALPNAPQSADADSAWLLLTLGIIPLYNCEDESVRFRFLQGDGTEFVFPWTQETLIGFWAPFVAIAPSWHLKFIGQKLAPDSPYWSALRSALIEKMDGIDMGNKLSQ